jgi:hypothetical protein
MVNGPVRRCRAHKYRCLFLYPFALFASLACGQDLPIPTVDSLPTSTRKVATPPLEVKAPTQQPHRFWDRTNILLFSGVGAMRALDYASTRNMQRRGREEILLPDDVVNNSAGFAALEAAGTAASIGLSYWMHRTRHHSLERWISIVHISITGFGAVRNYSLDSHHPTSAP